MFRLVGIKPIGLEYQVTIESRVGKTLIKLQYLSESDGRKFEVTGPVTHRVSSRMYGLSMDLNDEFKRRKGGS